MKLKDVIEFLETVITLGIVGFLVYLIYRFTKSPFIQVTSKAVKKAKNVYDDLTPDYPIPTTPVNPPLSSWIIGKLQKWWLKYKGWI